MPNTEQSRQLFMSCGHRFVNYQCQTRTQYQQLIR